MYTSSTVHLYKSTTFPIDLSRIDDGIRNLFNHLINDLSPMDKHGMSGSCRIETTQMENFLKDSFHFQNTSDYIVQGVRSFRIDRPPNTLNPDMIIKFPSEHHPNPFEMTIGEIQQWQKSYMVYVPNEDDLAIDEHFLKRALQGQSDSGDEAFLMKFVVRISTCPILMEFDAKIIERKIEDDWPNRIKLVSVTGVDFAGRIHDVKDVQTYVTNWKNVYEIDPYMNLPVVYGGRDFRPLGVAAILDIERLYHDLMRMARIRLLACDHEGVQVVVETGIGLGVFAGRQIGIDHQTRSLSAKAVKQVLEEDGEKYSNIKAIVFAMPIFEFDESTSTYNCFVQSFKDEYEGKIPILIADQDMHRLTVAIAKQGFIVSELNPADSHGVFGEYWQNRGPAVEEKLALTTVGLLIQHHLFNGEHVLNPTNYKYIPTNIIHHRDIRVPIPATRQNSKSWLEILQGRIVIFPMLFTWIVLYLFYRKR